MINPKVNDVAFKIKLNKNDCLIFFKQMLQIKDSTIKTQASSITTKDIYMINFESCTKCNIKIKVKIVTIFNNTDVYIIFSSF